jgi:hypothetical protein
MVKPYYPRKETTPGTAVVIANSFNGSISRGFGRKAQSIADITGMQVYAYDRKGTGTRYTFTPGLRHELTPSRAVQNANWMADIICREFDSSVKDVILYGHSGAGPEMAALARTEKLPASGLGLSDPVAVRSVGIVKGLAATAWYNAYHVSCTVKKRDGPSWKHFVIKIYGNQILRSIVFWRLRIASLI